MDGIGARKLGDADDFVDRQVAFDRSEIARQMRAAADLVTFVRLEPMQRQLVLFRPDRHRFYAQFIGGAENANSDFGSVGDKDLGYGQGGLLKQRKRDLCCTREINP